MKQGIILAAALLAGALAANLLLADPGYAAFRFAGFLIEMSAVTFVLVAVVTYFLVRLVLRAIGARSWLRQRQDARRHGRARKALARGLLEMSEGEWAKSEDTLVQSAREAEIPSAHYLVAARAAELQGATQRRDEWLAKALETAGDRRAPALIMQAEMHLRHKQAQAALATLDQLEATGEQNTRGLLLLARALRQTGDWQRLQAIEPRLRGAKGVTAAAADETVTQIHMDRLKAAATARDVKLLSSAWKEMPKAFRQRGDIVVAYARAAMTCDEHASAEAELRGLLERQWDEAAVLAYGDLDPDEPFEILERAERWLPKHSQDAALLLSCARLSLLGELYGKARSYLEASLAIKPRLETYQMLAALLEQLGDHDRAYTALNEGLTLALGRKPVLPKIHARRWIERRQQERRRD